MITGSPMDEDHVGRIAWQWQKEMPDVDLSGMNVIGRARRLTLLTRKPIEAIFSEYGLDAGEFDVLATLRRSGPPYQLRPTEIQQALMISSGGLTDRLNRLEAQGLLVREPSMVDGRSLPVRLTEKGRDQVAAAFQRDMELEAGLIDSLSESERSQLVDLMKKLLKRLEL